MEDEFETEKQELTLKQKISRIIRAIVAIAVILGIMYVSGVYQYLFYRKTPATIKQERMKSMLEAEIISLPLSVFIVSGEDSWRSERAEGDIQHLVQNASNIWAQANIRLEIKKIILLNVSNEEKELFFNNPRLFVKNVKEYEPSTINVFLTKLLNGLNGIAFGSTQSVAVAEFTSSYDFRVLAHEIGHILNLSHTQDKQDLMSQGAGGNALTLDEILIAREAAHRIIKK